VIPPMAHLASALRGWPVILIFASVAPTFVLGGRPETFGF
jgi:hypothetical protein